MTRFTVAISMVLIFASHARAAEQKEPSSDETAAQIKALLGVSLKDSPSQIKAFQNERVAVLTRLVSIFVAQYSVGQIRCQPVIGAEMDLADAQLDTTDQPAARIALLTEGLKKETEFLKVAEGRFKMGTGSQADYEWARALTSYSKIRILIAQQEGGAKVKALHKERVEALRTLADIYFAQYRTGATECATFIGAETARVNAEMDAADTADARVTALRRAATMEAAFLNTVDEKLKMGLITELDLCRARALLLGTRIRLLREESGEKNVVAQVRTLQRERAAALSKFVESCESARKMGLEVHHERLIRIRSELLSTQLEIADTPEERAAMLTEHLTRAIELLRALRIRHDAGYCSEAEVLQATNLVLDAKIRLLRERSAQKAAPK